MHDFRPVAQITGRLVFVLGAAMLLPAAVDFADAEANALALLVSALLTMTAGLAMSVTTRQIEVVGLTRPQAFLVTVLVWAVLPVFGALPFVIGAPLASYTDAYFEAMSGLTTTGSTVFSGLDEAPRGMLLWRGMLQWFGGLGIVIVAIVFLPAMRVGGMQFFRTEAFDLGQIMPRATEIAASLLWLYVALTVGAIIAYEVAGLGTFDAIVHAFTTVSTGGFSNYDSGFGVFSPAAHYVGALFMTLGALPFVSMIRTMRGDLGALARDAQVRAFLAVLALSMGAIFLWLVIHDHHRGERALREAVFNVTSVLTGTGYTSDAYDRWGGFAVAVFFLIPLIGGCTGSTACSAKVFRYQILWTALFVQLRRLQAPHGVYPLRYQGRPVEPEVVSSIMAYFLAFIATLTVTTVLLSLMGLDNLTALSAAVAAVANLGPGLGPTVGPEGNFAALPVEAKWLLSAGMLLGRLEFLSVFVLALPLFWRR